MGALRGAATTLDALGADTEDDFRLKAYTSFLQFANVGSTPFQQERFGMGLTSTLLYADQWEEDGQQVQAVRVWICVEDGPGVGEEIKACLVDGGEWQEPREEQCLLIDGQPNLRIQSRCPNDLHRRRKNPATRSTATERTKMTGTQRVGNMRHSARRLKSQASGASFPKTTQSAL